MEEANKPQPLLAALAAAKEETATLAIAAKAANLADCNVVDAEDQAMDQGLSLIQLSEPTRPRRSSSAVFCMNKNTNDILRTRLRSLTYLLTTAVT